jgi:5-methylcytosine-specific restriction endonuclease McrA
MDPALRQFVRERAGDICEYCRLAQSAIPFAPFHVEHIVARQHGGADDSENLALACDRCNAYKGPNLTAIDPISRKVVSLFHPRRDRWSDHMALREDQILGLTDRGRATTELLKMNAPRRVQLRAELKRIGDSGS